MTEKDSSPNKFDMRPLEPYLKRLQSKTLLKPITQATNREMRKILKPDRKG